MLLVSLNVHKILLLLYPLGQTNCCFYESAFAVKWLKWCQHSLHFHHFRSPIYFFFHLQSYRAGRCVSVGKAVKMQKLSVLHVFLSYLILHYFFFFSLNLSGIWTELSLYLELRGCYLFISAQQSMITLLMRKKKVVNNRKTLGSLKEAILTFFFPQLFFL